jgi:hypothetical protein
VRLHQELLSTIGSGQISIDVRQELSGFTAKAAHFFPFFDFFSPLKARLWRDQRAEAKARDGFQGHSR